MAALLTHRALSTNEYQSLIINAWLAHLLSPRSSHQHCGRKPRHNLGLLLPFLLLLHPILKEMTLTCPWHFVHHRMMKTFRALLLGEGGALFIAMSKEIESA